MRLYGSNLKQYSKLLDQLRIENTRAQLEMQYASLLPCAPAIGVHRPYCECGVSGPASEEK